MKRSEQNTWRVTQGKQPLKPMADVVDYMEDYIGTYMKQLGADEYSDETFISDMLYGLGAALSDDYKFAQGFDKFKKRLVKHMEEEC